MSDVRSDRFDHFPDRCPRNSAAVTRSRRIHPSAAMATPGVCESIWYPLYQEPYVKSSICSGNQIKASNGTQIKLTSSTPDGTHHARK
jgi:hypothetical protein